LSECETCIETTNTFKLKIISIHPMIGFDMPFATNAQGYSTSDT